MQKLILNASRTDRTPLNSILKNGKAPGYAIPQKIVNNINPGDTVILIDKRKKLMVEGTIIKLVDTRRKTTQGLHRYDVFINNLKAVPYKSMPINRWGVGYVFKKT